MGPAENTQPGAGLSERTESETVLRSPEQRAKRILDKNERKYSSAGGGVIRLCILCVFVDRSWPTNLLHLLTTPTKLGAVAEVLIEDGHVHIYTIYIKHIAHSIIHCIYDETYKHMGKCGRNPRTKGGA